MHESCRTHSTDSHDESRGLSDEGEKIAGSIARDALKVDAKEGS